MVIMEEKGEGGRAVICMSTSNEPSWDNDMFLVNCSRDLNAKLCYREVPANQGPTFVHSCPNCS